MIEFDWQAPFSRGRLYQSGDVEHGELLRELIVDAAFSTRRRIHAGDFDTAHRVSDIEEAAGLTTFSIHGERVADCGLRAEAIQDGAEDFVVIEAVDESLAHGHFNGDG